LWVVKKSAQLRCATRANAIDGLPGLGVPGDQRLPAAFQVIACHGRYTQGFEPLRERPLPRAANAVEQSRTAAIAEAINVSKLCRIQG